MPTEQLLCRRIKQTDGVVVRVYRNCVASPVLSAHRQSNLPSSAALPADPFDFGLEVVCSGHQFFDYDLGLTSVSRAVIFSSNDR